MYNWAVCLRFQFRSWQAEIAASRERDDTTEPAPAGWPAGERRP